MENGIDRRSVLICAALLPVAACTAEPSPPPPPPPDPDDLLRSAAVDRERDLLEQYDAALLAVPALAGRLATVREEHAAHLRALLPDAAGGEPTSSASAASTAEPVPAPDPAAALTALSAAEGAAGGAHASAALQAGPQLAGLLASLAASEASHRVVLG